MLTSYSKKALSSLDKKSPKAQKQLIKALTKCIPQEDVEHFDIKLYKNMISEQWKLAKNRKPGEIKIKIRAQQMDNTFRRKTVVDIVSDDLAFIIDSVAAAINFNKCLIDLLIHPVFYVLYNTKGQLEDLSTTNKKGYIRQSHIHIHIHETLSNKALKDLEAELRATINDVATANKDWPTMLEKLKESSTELAASKTPLSKTELANACEFLDYLHNNNFTLLGYREYKFIETRKSLSSRTMPKSSLGLLYKDERPAYISDDKEGLPRNLQEMRRSLPPVSISKTNRISTVHRRVPMDTIAIKTYDDKGNVSGEKLFIGLFTSVTYSRSVSDVPFLREKVERIMSLSDFQTGSHDRKALRHILEKYPRDELFQIGDKELYDICRSILRLQERQHIALFLRKDTFKRYISCLVYVPRDRFGTFLRKQITSVLEEELNGTCASFYSNMDDSMFARTIFRINVSQKNPPNYNAATIEAKLQALGQTWTEKLYDCLTTTLEDEQKITKLTLKYGEAFQISYTSRHTAAQAVFDIEKIEEVIKTNRLQLDLYRPRELESHQLRLKVHNPDAPLTLSDVMPILENMGLRAISELPFEVSPDGTDKKVWIHDFLLETPQSQKAISIKNVKDKFEDAFTQIYYGAMESDPLNQLILGAQMEWKEIIILRSYTKYLKQARLPYSQNYIQNALTTHSNIAGKLVKLFLTIHNPHNQEHAETEAHKQTSSIKRSLRKVDSLDYDRIMRSLLTCINATLRTNFFQTDEHGNHKPALSIKMDSKQIDFLPDPKPFREIFVYSPRVEAVHLRGDKIARGGLRWSDRHEDFRTEVLGLMKAQMVKNSVIVPMGSKGGFVVKTQTHSRDEFMAEGIECYKTFLRGMLDITDNLKGTKVIPPKDVVRLDGDDPYLVVAADKGTATFSDIANSLSQEYGFWLDDAFASGGSAGYDHKKMGITARGAWESVKLHFRQLNHNTQTQPFDVIGIGDMGGDVFGNGMLLSEHIRLVGAFNHLHIFCDPNPDTGNSFKERQRLFDGVMGWDKYKTKLLSKGGRIYSRSDKTLELTPEIMQRFDIEDKKVTPNELMRAILKSRTDLLWFGGIGTYIKAKSESHADAGDKANDSLRLNGSDIRAKVIGEGANLGTTQLGRIEFAQRGGKINTDFIDNSGGVDSSDHEVNIKILLSTVMSNKKHKMDLKARNKLLEKMTCEIEDHVLRHNYQQAQAVSLMEIDAQENLELHNDLIVDLEHEQGLDRDIEFLPDAKEIEIRLEEGRGLTRPELSILISYSKIAFTGDLLASDVPDSPEMQSWLMDYFPDILEKKFAPEIKDHKLAREIIATMMASSLINRMGPTFIKSRMKKTGASCDAIAKSYILVREIYQLRELWDSIEALDNQVPAQVQLNAMNDIASLSAHAITWFLTRLGHDIDIATEVKNYGDSIKQLSNNIKTLVAGDLKEGIEMRTQAGINNGLPPAMAHQIAILPVLTSACDIIRIALQSGTDVHRAAKTYFAIGHRFQLDWLRTQATYLDSGSQWQKGAINGLIEHIYSSQASLTIRILKDMKGKIKSENGGRQSDLAKIWSEKHAGKVTDTEALFERLRAEGTISLPKLVLAEQQLRNLSTI